MHPHRAHVVQSIEVLIQALFVYQYLSDTSTLLFLTRSLFHLHCVNLREWHATRSVRFFAGFLLLSFSHATVRHSWGTAGKTLVLDFIGCSFQPSRLHFVILDGFIFLLQLITVIIVWEMGHRDVRDPDPLSSSEDDAIPDLDIADLSELKHAALQPIFILRFRHVWQRLSVVSNSLAITLPPPVSAAS